MILQLRWGPDTTWVADYYGVPPLHLAAAWRVMAVTNPRQSLVPGWLMSLYWQAVSAAYKQPLG